MKSKELFLVSSSGILAFSTSLLLYYHNGTVIVHPYLSFVGLVASVGFVILSILKSKEEKKP